MKAAQVKLAVGMQVELNGKVWEIARVTRTAVYLETAGFFPQKVCPEVVKLAIARKG